MSKITKRVAAGALTAALVAGGLALNTPFAAADKGTCVTADETLTLFGFNDFHGHIEQAAGLFTPIENARTTQGDDNVLVTVQGDSIGASPFVSRAGDDVPSTDVLKAGAIDSMTAGNHEFDKGWSDFETRINNDAWGAPVLGANVYDNGTTTVASPLKPYTIVEKAGLKIAVVGGVTSSLPSLVSPDGISDLTIGDPVEAVNTWAALLSDGVEDADNPEADIVIASFHEGAPDGEETAAQNAAESPNFDEIYEGVDSSVDFIFTGHTHQVYQYTSSSGIPIYSAGEGGEGVIQVDVEVDSTNRGICSSESAFVSSPRATDANPDPFADTPRIAEIQSIVAAAKAASKEIGAVVIGDASEAVSTPKDGSTGTRNEESPMTNAVAQMFYDRLSDGDSEFIGIQNPGGTRASVDAGDITYEEAANVLPFANSLFTTELTGAQFKTILEQQWQRDKNGEVAERPFLQVGLSRNVSYTYDESREEGDRITSIRINGAPIDPEKTYTIGSGSFLITGGDNFWEFKNGQNTTDTGLVDLDEWVAWVEDMSPLSPDYTKRGVSTTQTADEVEIGGEVVSFTFGQTLEDGVAPQSLDMLLGEGEKVSPQLANTTITAYIGDTKVGSGTVENGAGTVEVSLPSDSEIVAGDYTVRFVVEASGTEIFWPITVTGEADKKPQPPASTLTPKDDEKPGLPKTGI